MLSGTRIVRSKCPGPYLVGFVARRIGGGWKFAFRESLDAVAFDDGPLAEQGFADGEILFRAVARMVGFGLGRSKMLYLF
jgi:hypothetical protein